MQCSGTYCKKDTFSIDNYSSYNQLVRPGCSGARKVDGKFKEESCCSQRMQNPCQWLCCPCKPLESFPSLSVSLLNPYLLFSCPNWQKFNSVVSIQTSSRTWCRRVCCRHFRWNHMHGWKLFPLNGRTDFEEDLQWGNYTHPVQYHQPTSSQEAHLFCPEWLPSSLTTREASWACVIWSASLFLICGRLGGCLIVAQLFLSTCSC